MKDAIKTRLTRKKPFIVPVFIPHRGCLHRCVFCNQQAITGAPDQALDPGVIRGDIETYLSYRGARRNRTEISFYGGTFLGLEPARIRCLLELAQGFIGSHGVDGLRFSTRPDTVTRKTLDLIEPYSVDTVELGVQSMDDGVLAASQRGHTADDTREAVSLLKDRGFTIGLQMMTGLPGDEHQKALETARAMAGLTPSFVRIYPTVVLKHSPLARLYRQGLYHPMGLEDSVNLVKELYLVFHDRGIPVIRMGLQASDGLDPGGEILDGPYHPSFGHMVYSALFLDMARRLLINRNTKSQSQVEFFVHPANISVIRGLKNLNIQVLTSEFNLRDIRVHGDESLDNDALKLFDTVADLTLSRPYVRKGDPTWT